MRRWMAAAVLALWWCGAPVEGWAGPMGAPPDPISLSADEETTIAGRDVVIKLRHTDLGTETVAVIDVAADPARVFDAVLDWSPRVQEVGALKAADVYLSEAGTEAAPERIGGRWELAVMGRTIVFHTLYEVDRSQTWCRYELDPAKENDLERVIGSYHVYAHGTGSRLIYRTITDTGYSVPDWLRKWLASGQLKEQMIGIRTRSENG